MSLYLNHLSTFLAEIWHDHSFGGKDHVERHNIDPAVLQYSIEIRHDPFLRGKDHVERKNSDSAALQYFMQCCRIYNQPISQPFLIKLS